MRRVFTVLAVMVIAATRWFSGSLGAVMFAARASGYILDLGLDVKRLPVLAKAKFFIEANAIHKTMKGRFSPKRFAMRFFGWYCVENTTFRRYALVRDGVLGDSISIMRSWALVEPDLSKAAEEEIHLIVMHLYRGFENLDIDKEEKMIAQLALLKAAANKQSDEV